MHRHSTFTPEQSAIRASRAGANCSPDARSLALAAAILAASMVFIDGTVVNVALAGAAAEIFRRRRKPLGRFFPALLVLGLGMAFTVALLTRTVMNTLEPGRAGGDGDAGGCYAGRSASGPQRDKSGVCAWLSPGHAGVGRAGARQFLLCMAADQ